MVEVDLKERVLFSSDRRKAYSFGHLVLACGRRPRFTSFSRADMLLPSNRLFSLVDNSSLSMINEFMLTLRNIKTLRDEFLANPIVAIHDIPDDSAALRTLEALMGELRAILPTACLHIYKRGPGAEASLEGYSVDVLNKELVVRVGG